MNKFKLKWILMFTIMFTGCSADTPKSDTPKSDIPRFVMDCKKLADKLKIEFLIQGKNDKPTCTVGTKDKVFGGLMGHYFRTQEELDGALAVLRLQKDLPFHSKLQKCNGKCVIFLGTAQHLKCWRQCAQAAGYYEENKP